MTAERIDHVAEARRHIEWAHEQQAEEGRYDHTVRDNALLANAEATLALVEQQRVANLIRLADAARAEYNTTFEESTGKFFLGLNRQIREGLGLT